MVDPGSYKEVIKEIKKNFLIPKAILLTHSHIDHINGASKIKNIYPNIKIFSSEKVNSLKIHQIKEKTNKIFVINKKIKILHTPGHTLKHISYYIKPYLFCGDTVFSGGCGKLYNEEYFLMYNSIQKICLLPNNTLICSGHEYTISNLNFSKKFLKNIFFKNYFIFVKKYLTKKKILPPTRLKIEKKINIFLLCNNVKFQKKIFFKNEFFYPWDLFYYIRNLKNNTKLI
ncbi:MBL fold metallo-hydrolase [Buchnera aphidicola]|uniref:MBL fold metallo-hydrolase n=1 Tax=Buchnera aphidicola TaxID=9 RepID=UPI0031B6B933